MIGALAAWARTYRAPNPINPTLLTGMLNLPLKVLFNADAI